VHEGRAVVGQGNDAAGWLPDVILLCGEKPRSNE